jgi:hypothetical protein
MNWSRKRLLLLNGNINKNYRLPLKRLHERRILELKNHDNRKKGLEEGSTLSLPIHISKVILKGNEY